MDIKMIALAVILAFFAGVIALVHFASKRDKQRQKDGTAPPNRYDSDGPG
jgi:hypothetical protein